MEDTIKSKLIIKDGIKKEKIFFDSEGKYHNIDDPAVIIFNSKGDIIKTIYYHHGMLHRMDGPAIIDGNIKKYYIFDKLLIEQEYVCKIFKNIVDICYCYMDKTYIINEEVVPNDLECVHKAILKAVDTYPGISLGIGT